ncbi:MAG: radical SAM protein [Candidatus Bathyarchaeota archaeon]|nr:radical SAM protein [Candidatus Bathyarchaeota archaeon]MDH5786663.1 radical SAM protein [Candidatus Bathyarchaeota archaeon]
MASNHTFAVKRVDNGKYALINSQIMPWEINTEGRGGALVLRYWGCSLRCALCYSQAYAYLDTGGSRVTHVASLKDVISALKDPAELRKSVRFSVAWTRIQGGEPLIDENRTLATALFSEASLKWMLKQKDVGNPRVVIQTNGMFLGECSDDCLNKFISMLKKGLPKTMKGRIAIEVSFKGGNPETAQRYAASLPLKTKILRTQVTGFFRLLKAVSALSWDLEEYRIAVYLVAGIGPRLSDPSFIPKDGKNESLPIFHPKTWSREFGEVITTFRQTLKAYPKVYEDYVRIHRMHIPMESMEPSKFQFGWTSKIDKRPELREYVRRYLRVSQKHKLRLYGSSIGSIPDADSQLLQRIAELKTDFYEAEPSSHYPYL